MNRIWFVVAAVVGVGCTVARAQSVEWTRLISEAQETYALAMAMDSTGIYVAGTVKGSLDGATAVSAQDGFIRKYDLAGQVLWTRQYGPPVADARGGLHAIAVTEAGIYAASSTLILNDGSFGNYDAYIYLFDLEGNPIWQRRIDANFRSDELVNGIAADSTGVLAFGYTQGTLTGQVNQGADDFFLVKYDPAGNRQLLRQFGGTGYDLGKDVAVCNGAVYVAGVTTSTFPGQINSGNYDAFVARLDGVGVAVWMRTYGSAGWDEALAIACTDDGIVVSGSMNGSTNEFRAPDFLDAYVRRYGAEGNLIWTRQFGTPRDDSAKAVSAYGSAIVVAGETAGAFPGFTPRGSSDMFLRAYSLDGEALATVQAGTFASDAGLATIVTPDGIFVSGYTSTGQVPPLVEAGFLTRYSGNGVFPPGVSPGGVVNNASFAPGPLAPGMIAAVFGSYLTDGTSAFGARIGSDGKLTTAMAGVSVRVGDFLAPIFYAIPSQLGIQIPVELAGQTSTVLRVTVGGKSSAPVALSLASTAPGIFMTGDGTRAAAALHQNGITPVTPGAPARRNEVIVLYATGLGQVTPAVTTGELATLNYTAIQPAVTVDHIPAIVEFSGLAPGFAGLYQVNVRIPAGARSAPETPVILSSGGRQSSIATIAISD